MTSRLALLGTGRMGAPIAALLVRAGFELSVWNRTPGKAKELVALGASKAATAVEAASRADIVLLALTDAAAVAEVLFDAGVAEVLATRGVVVDMSTIAPREARQHAAHLAALGVGALDAPVSGGTRGAQDGSLTIFVGGREEDFARAKPVLDTLGRATYLGPAGSGQVAKCANQLIVAVSIAAVAEALELAGAAGLDLGALRSALMGGFAESRILREHGSRMIERAFQPGGSVRNQVKDLVAIQSLADECALEIPVTDNVAALYRAAIEDGFGELDHSALLLELERRNAGPVPAETARPPSVAPKLGMTVEKKEDPWISA